MPKGHRQIVANNNENTVDPFGNNVAASQAYKAMERLVTATYMVTNLVPEDEILRGRIRLLSNDLLESTLELHNGFNSLGKDAVREITAQVRLALSLLDTLSTAGLISQMNLTILKEAFVSFVDNLGAMAVASSADGVELTKDYFDASLKSSTPIKMANSSDTSRLGTPNESTNHTNHNRNNNASKVRVNNIIEFITKRGSASVGDLSTIITNCSSKTLQRSLAMLVSRNILVKEGNKRWTRYFLA